MDEEESGEEARKALEEKLLDAVGKLEAEGGARRESADPKSEPDEGRKRVKETLQEAREKAIHGAKVAAAGIREISVKTKQEVGKGAAKTAETLKNNFGKLKELAAEKKEAWAKKAEAKAEEKSAKEQVAAVENREKLRQLEAENLDLALELEAERKRAHEAEKRETLEKLRQLKAENLDLERKLEAERKRVLEAEKRASELGQAEEARKAEAENSKEPKRKKTGKAAWLANLPGNFGKFTKAELGVAGAVCAVCLIVYTVVVAGISSSVCGQEDAETQAGYEQNAEVSGENPAGNSEAEEGWFRKLWNKHGDEIKGGGTLAAAAASGFVTAKVTDKRYSIEEEFALLWECLYTQDYDGSVTRYEYGQRARCCAESLREIEKEFPSVKKFRHSGFSVGASCPSYEDD